MGGSSKKQTVGFWYSASMHFGLCRGPINSIKRIIVAERDAWIGDATAADGEIAINRTDLFGGEKREGGVYGTVNYSMGSPGSVVAPIVETRYKQHNASWIIPSYRGMVTAFFRNGPRAYFPATLGDGFTWSAMNPYFKKVWFEVFRSSAGWDGAVWYSTRLMVNGYDVNPIHFLYECVTNRMWGMGLPAEQFIEDSNWRAAADTLYSEGFGISLIWDFQAPVEELIKQIETHINGRLRLNIETGRYHVDLLRANYTIESLPILDPDNSDLITFRRTLWGDGPNEVVVRYTDRNQDQAASAPAQDLAAIESQGGINSTVKNYPFVRTLELANRLALRDLDLYSASLAKVRINANRIAWNWYVGKVFALRDPSRGIDLVPFRILDINKGDIANGVIQIDAMEDIFGMPLASYTSAPTTGWTDPASDPMPATIQRVVEAPYYDVQRSMPAADLAYLPATYAFAQLIAAEPTPDSLDFALWASPNNTLANYVEVDTGLFSATAVLADAIPNARTQITVNLTNVIDGGTINTATDYALIDSEIFPIDLVVVNAEAGTAAITLRRGSLDTIPAAHAIGTRVYFVSDSVAVDPTTRTQGQTVFYRILPRTGRGELAIASATAMSIAFVGRAQRPYPPGRFRIADQVAPTVVAGDIKADWAHRNRLQQTAGLIDTEAASVTPEPGTTYTIQLRNATSGTVLATFPGYTGVTATVSSNFNGMMRLELWSVRDGYTSLQTWSHDFLHTPLARPENSAARAAAQQASVTV
jgi:hypothetical protein